jgi:hypothetical protein
MKVKKIKVENYKAIKGSQEFIPNGSSFLLIGANGKGKTTIGRSIMDVLTKDFPSKPIHEGELEGAIEIELTDGSKVIAKLSDGKSPKIEFYTNEDMKVTVNNSILKSLSGEGMSFDIDEFLSMAPKPRRELLEKIAGVSLDDLNEVEAELMEQAKDLRRQKKHQQGKVREYDEELAVQEQIDVKDLYEQLNEVKDHNRIVERAEERLGNIEGEIMRLEQELKKANEARAKGVAFLKENQIKDTKELEQRIESADDLNAQIKEAKEAQDEAMHFDTIEENLRKVEGKIASARKEKEVRLSKNPLPAEGLSFSAEGELLIDGLPFESNQVSTSRKIIAGIQIKESLLGKIKFLHFDAAALDKKNADKIVEWAESRGLQLCVERPIWDEEEQLKFELYYD